MDKAGDRQPVDGLRPLDGVPPGDDGPRLVGFCVAAPENFLHRLSNKLGCNMDVQLNGFRTTVLDDKTHALLFRTHQ